MITCLEQLRSDDSIFLIPTPGSIVYINDEYKEISKQLYKYLWDIFGDAMIYKPDIEMLIAKNRKNKLSKI